MSAYRFSNNYEETLGQAIAPADTTITVPSATGLPSLTGVEFFMATLETSGGGILEIVKVTEVVGNDLTVVRAQEGTSATAFLIGDKISVRLTAGALNQFAAVDHNHDSEYDAIGSAATVQSNLDTHEADTANPHSVTAAQAGADPAGSAATVQSNLDTHEADTANPHSVSNAQVNAPGVSDDSSVPASSMLVAILTAAEYSALGTWDTNTIYFING